MGSTGVIIVQVLAKDSAKVGLIEDNDMIQTIPTNGSDHAFNERILPRRARRRDHILDIETLDPPLDSFSINSISVSQEVARSRIEPKRLNDLLSCPPSIGMLGYVEVHNLATVVAEYTLWLQNLLAYWS